MAELKTFVFTDISGSVRLKDEMSGRSVTERDVAFITSILTPHRQRIEARLAEFGGRVVSTAGDGHFLVFDHTVEAAQWAVDVQKSHQSDPIVTPKDEHVEVRMSMHVGVPQIDPSDRDNFVGKTVDYAARLNDYATGGQILVSRSVMAILEDVGLEGVRLHLQGRRNLKGIGNVEIHELLYDDHGPRPMRNQPKSHTERQWTVVPTQGFEPAHAGGSVGVAGHTALKRVGNYELEEVIGAGGMGDVYKAHHTQFGRVRAVKVIKPQFVVAGHQDVIRRFYNEIKAVGRLEHKNIVVAIDSSSPDDKLHYLVMEFIEGLSLDEMVTRHGPLPVAESCEIIRQAARGLQYIHKHEMVHRDIKPSNLMVTLVDADQISGDSTLVDNEEGERAVVKILDLGLALLAVDNQDRLTRFDHKAMGTGMYMPPEQWKTTSVDIRADIYSLGCTLYHLLAGNPPFFDSDLRPEKAHEKSAVPPIRSSMQPLPRKLWDVLQKMLEKRPEDRYGSPAEVAAALAPFAEGHQLAALVRTLEGDEIGTHATTPTKPNGNSKAETWRSRSRFSSASLIPTRRFVLTKGLPLLFLAFAIGGIYWMVTASREHFRQREAEVARTNLASYARSAAKVAMPQELTKRFSALAKAASDEKLIAMVDAIDKKPEDDALYPPLLDWIKDLPYEHGKDIAAESWFIQDARGVQIARWPKDDGSYKKDYWYRDYFHGTGKEPDKNDPVAKAAAKPITEPHLSCVYSSSTSKLLKVAFSVPIWKPVVDAEGEPELDENEKPRREVIGVLAMSVNLKDFTVLDKSMSGGSQVVLIDLRDDWVEPTKDRGLVLHHPEMDEGNFVRLDKELLGKIDAANPLEAEDFDGEEHFLTGYFDPVDGENGKKYWGVFEPVRYAIDQGEGENTDRFGWIVLVQQPMGE
jgi:serine/threonine protein kinase/class 3 adenylate cyclase